MGVVNSVSAPLVYLSILVVAVCGIIYELIIGAVSSYLWGDSIFYFSVTIGLYMSALGLGAFISKFLKKNLFDWFVLSEVLIGLIGGCSALFLFWSYSSTELYEYAMVTVTLAIGAMVGLEIPLLIRIMEEQESLRQNVAHVLTYDYIGGLVGALVFPLFLLPVLGLMQTAIVLGLSNLVVALVNFVRHRGLLRYFPQLAMLTLLAGLLLGYLFLNHQNQTEALEQRMYRDTVIFTKQTPYQQLTLTHWHNDLRLFINGGLQFSSIDEYRYHEALVHVAFAAVRDPKQLLILGGGDGLALREALKYPNLDKITLVDIDPEMTKMSTEQPLMAALNHNSLENPKVQIVHEDAYKFVERYSQFYDVIVVDLPDPNHTALSKLYSREFYELIKRRLSYKGVVVTQSTSPFFASQAFWCINQTMTATGLKVLPFHVEIPSFGNWGFQLASKNPLTPTQLKIEPGLELQYLNQATLPGLFVFPEDMQLETQVRTNTLIQPVILDYYQKGWNGIR